MSSQLESFGKYLLLEKLAAGGMAEIYLAKSIGAGGIGKFVAIKRILPQFTDNPEFVEMFKEEAKVVMNLNHGNIVSIYDFGIEHNQFYLVMEYVEGQNLRQVLNHMKKENKEFSTDQIIYMVKEVAAGLDHAHRCLDSTTGRPLNITHRDMSPQNVMVSFEGEVKVVDFGIAKAETQLEQTRAGTIKGKFGYMSPEQADGHTVDLRTDIFALGIILWELLAKDRLFTAQSEAATLRKIRDCNIPSLRKINPAVHPDLEKICMKALAKDRTLRYQTAAAFNKDLNRFLNTHYPDFSPHEFSVFMKSLYSQMYLDNRKKLSDYARIDATPGTGADSERTAVTQTATMTSTQTASSTGAQHATPPSSVDEQEHSIAGEGFVVDPAKSQKIDLSSLKLDEKPIVKKVPASTQTGITATKNRPMGTQTQIRVQQQTPPPANNNLLYAAVLGLLVAVGGWWYWQNQKKALLQHDLAAKPTHSVEMPPPSPAPADPTKPQGQIDAASTGQLVPFNIQSTPSGATIYVDDKALGVTPYIGSIETNRLFRLKLLRDGYLPYEMPSVKANPDGYTLKATMMPEPPSGYVTIEVFNGGVDPVITVNGVRLTEKPPIQNYKVPAGANVTIKAVNPYSNLQAQESFVIGQGQRKFVRLYLGRTAGGQ
ncbi:MAG: hypothetical protein BroJett040_22120 [Oligoflexia bacterium]|nr:MAG: hypothetical protein BroJett040_22120 [Oligoflexia bacterium]